MGIYTGLTVGIAVFIGVVALFVFCAVFLGSLEDE